MQKVQEASLKIQADVQLILTATGQSKAEFLGVKTDLAEIRGNIQGVISAFTEIKVAIQKCLQSVHCQDVDTICNSKFPGLHSTKLKKKILSIFWATRVGHYLRLQNSQRSLGVRHRNKKSVINQHE